MGFEPKTILNVTQNTQTVDTKTMAEIDSENQQLPDIPQQISTPISTPLNENASGSSTVGESAELSYDKSKKTAVVDNLFGSPSLFNKMAIFVHPTSNDANGFASFKDLSGEQKIYSTEIPDVKQVIDRFKNDPVKRLHYADFAWSKWYKHLAMNRLIILRRFPFPTYNNLVFANNDAKDRVHSKDIKPLSKAVTYFGGNWK
jgi:hypothetical protein